MLARYLRNLCEQLVESEKPLILKVSKSNLEIIEPSRGSVGEEMSKKLDLSLRWVYSFVLLFSFKSYSKCYLYLIPNI